MAIIRKDVTSEHFAQIPNHWMRDPRLSGKAKAYLVYIAGHRTDYDLTMKQMIAQMREGAAAIYAGLKELEEVGYLIRHRQRGERGKLGGVDWEIVEWPEGAAEATTSRFSTRGEPTSGETTRGGSTTKKTTSKNTKVQEVKDSENTHSLSEHLAELDEAWSRAAPQVPNQRRERVDVLKDQKFKTNGHRLIAKLGWNEAWADYFISQFEWRYDVNSMTAWMVAADRNGTLVECVQEVLDDYNAEHGHSYVADRIGAGQTALKN